MPVEKSRDLYVHMTYNVDIPILKAGADPMPNNQSRIARGKPARVERLGFRLDEET